MSGNGKLILRKFFISPELDQDLNEFCKRTGVSRSHAIMDAIKNVVNDAINPDAKAPYVDQQPTITPRFEWPKRS